MDAATRVRSHMRRGYMHMGIVCWLNGDVELLARRVAKDGIEKRPLLAADAPEGADPVVVAQGKLSNILEQRSK
jgi:shikimate kinase